MSRDVSVCVLISIFASLVDFLLCIASSTVGLKICPLAAAIKKYKSILVKKGKTMINSLFSKTYVKHY